MPAYELDEIAGAVVRDLAAGEPSRQRGGRPERITEGHDRSDVRPLQQVVDSRRSVRVLGKDPLDLKDLINVLREAESFHGRHWGRQGEPPQVLIASFDVPGLPGGLHQKVPGAGQFESYGAPLWLPELLERYTKAPCLALVCVGQGPPVASYRSRVVGAGAFGYGLWLAARTFGLEASAYGRSYNEVSWEGQRQAPLRHQFCIAIGHPRAQSI